MRTALQHIVARTYKPLLVRYLSKTRVFRYGSLRLEIPPQVFHPGFFFSTRLLLNYVRSLPLEGQKFLELGCGSGLLSMVAAQQNAIVTASDINPVAIAYMEKNSAANNLAVTIIASDLFTGIPAQAFDIIAINPPYYKIKPRTFSDYAWYCGENGEYFDSLFDGLHSYVHSDTHTCMVLFEGCDLDMIFRMAAARGFRLNRVKTHRNFLEKNYIYKIESAT